MKKITLAVGMIATMIACKQQPKQEVVEEQSVVEEKVEVVVKDRSGDFPKEVAEVFKAHGGIKAFDEKNTLVFTLTNPKGDEKHTTDLKSRRARIETDKYALGFDGKEAWIAQDSTYFKGDPRFYHNLMFYFYAMPFVLGDDGITYENVDDLTVEDKTYGGIKISYAAGVGESPKDNYFLYFDKESKEMKFLGYTVTYFSKETSDKVSLIEYSEWEDIDGLKLPKTLKWREFKDGKVGEVKNEMNFVKASASVDQLEDSTYQKPADKEIKETATK